MKRTFGRIVKPDARDAKYALKAARTARVSRTWNTRSLSLDQKQTPKCVAFAWAHWLYSPPVKNFFDPTALYDACKATDGIPEEDGTYVRAAAKILQRCGLISAYRWATTLNALVTTVLERAPVVVGTNWYEGMDDGGLMTLEGDCLGGHAYLIVGANRKSCLFTIKNSWGPAWGDDGFAEISFADMERLLDEDGECCLAIESKPEAAWLK